MMPILLAPRQLPPIPGRAAPGPQHVLLMAFPSVLGMDGELCWPCSPPRARPEGIPAGLRPDGPAPKPETWPKRPAAPSTAFFFSPPCPLPPPHPTTACRDDVTRRMRMQAPIRINRYAHGTAGPPQPRPSRGHRPGGSWGEDVTQIDDSTVNGVTSYANDHYRLLGGRSEGFCVSSRAERLPKRDELLALCRQRLNTFRPWPLRMLRRGCCSANPSPAGPGR